MTDIIEVTRKELTSSEVAEHVENGNRVIIRLEFMGVGTRVVIRRQSDTYYCDTPMKLLTFDSARGLQDCLERFGMADKATKERTTITQPGSDVDSGSEAVATSQ